MSGAAGGGGHGDDASQTNQVSPSSSRHVNSHAAHRIHHRHPQPDAEALDVLDLLDSQPNTQSVSKDHVSQKQQLHQLLSSSTQVEGGEGGGGRREGDTAVSKGSGGGKETAGIAPASNQTTSSSHDVPFHKPNAVETTPIVYFNSNPLDSEVSNHSTRPRTNHSVNTNVKHANYGVLPPFNPPGSPKKSNEKNKDIRSHANAHIDQKHPTSSAKKSILLTSGATEDDLKHAAEEVRRALGDHDPLSTFNQLNGVSMKRTDLDEKKSSDTSISNTIVNSSIMNKVTEDDHNRLVAEAETTVAAAFSAFTLTKTSTPSPTPGLASSASEQSLSSNNNVENGQMDPQRSIHLREELGNKNVSDAISKQALAIERRALQDRATFIEFDPQKEMILKLYACTWNMFGLPPPHRSELEKFIPPETFDLYVIGTEECENSIAMSLIFSSKTKWMAALKDLMGNNYVEIASDTLQAIHCIAFARRELAPLITRVETQTVATGIADIFGNKGGVAISMDIGYTSFLFINAHFTSGDSACDRRNGDYQKINSRLTLRANAPRVTIIDQPVSLQRAEPRQALSKDDAKTDILKETQQKQVLHEQNLSQQDIDALSTKSIPGEDIVINTSPEAEDEDDVDDGVISPLARDGNENSGKVSQTQHSKKVLRAPLLGVSASGSRFSTAPSGWSEHKGYDGDINGHVTQFARADELNRALHPPLSRTPAAVGATVSSNSTENVPSANLPLSNSNRNAGEPRQISLARTDETGYDTASINATLDATFDATARFDCVIWMGDFNYRVKLTRSLVEKLLRTLSFSSDGREILLNNDELRQEMQAQRVFAGCIEGPITFPPTYKYDLETDQYDSSEKQRTPSWTDRIVWKRNPSKILLERYDSCRTVRTSDHRPVFAHFLIRVMKSNRRRRSIGNVNNSTALHK